MTGGQGAESGRGGEGGRKQVTLPRGVEGEFSGGGEALHAASVNERR